MIVTEENKSEFLANAKRILGIEDNAEDELISYIIDDTISMVLAHCRLQILPYQLYGLIPQMTVSVYKSCKNTTGASAIWEGDRKIEYRTEEVLADYSSRLKPFMNNKGRVPSEVSADE